ncbi:hypothetical protein Droror1_Dr00016035 [Drosera rotundifolia]
MKELWSKYNRTFGLTKSNPSVDQVNITIHPLLTSTPPLVSGPPTDLAVIVAFLSSLNGSPPLFTSLTCHCFFLHRRTNLALGNAWGVRHRVRRWATQEESRPGIIGPGSSIPSWAVPGIGPMPGIKPLRLGPGSSIPSWAVPGIEPMPGIKPLRLGPGSEPLNEVEHQFGVEDSRASVWNWTVEQQHSIEKRARGEEEEE